MKLSRTIGLVILAAGLPALAHAEGGELGNAFIPFASRLGHFSLEYSKDWRLNDLSSTTSFAEERAGVAPVASFLSVTVQANGAGSVVELLQGLMRANPGMSWTPVTLGGLSGLESTQGGIRTIVLLRAPGDQLTLRIRSSSEKSDEVVTHMLNTFRSE